MAMTSSLSLQVISWKRFRTLTDTENRAVPLRQLSTFSEPAMLLREHMASFGSIRSTLLQTWLHQWQRLQLTMSQRPVLTTLTKFRIACRALILSRKRGCMFLLALVCVYVCVCLSVTTITKTIVGGFVPNSMGRFLGGKWRPSSCFVTIGRGMWK